MQLSARSLHYSAVLVDSASEIWYTFTDRNSRKERYRMSILFFAPWKNDDSEIQLRFSTFSSTADYWTSELHWHEYFGYPFIQSYAGEAFDELIEKFELLQESLGMVEKAPLSGCSGLRAAPGAYCFICSRALRSRRRSNPIFPPRIRYAYRRNCGERRLQFGIAVLPTFQALL